jgi:hypothetical protein
VRDKGQGKNGSERKPRKPLLQMRVVANANWKEREHASRKKLKKPDAFRRPFFNQTMLVEC